MNFSSEKFCLILAEKQLSLSEIARKANISASTISRYKRNKIKPRIKNIGKLAKALNVDIRQLIKS